jgi:hypothetical protein
MQDALGFNKVKQRTCGILIKISLQYVQITARVTLAARAKGKVKVNLPLCLTN